ncbi:MAG TPA: ASKHA domain-containing protein [Anaerolineales bacterium]|nr:ASKHA domain-containing protein [Anaerolineales bacterium]
MGDQHLVIFQPSGRRGKVAAGTTIKEASRQLGVDIESICGEKQTCGKCLVRVEEGFFERFGIESAPGHCGPLTASETRFFEKRKRDPANYRLSCVAPVMGDLLVFVPEETRAGKQLVRKTARDIAITLRPAIRRCYVELLPPSLHEALGDWERLKAELEARFGLQELSIDIHTLRALAGTLRKAEWKVSVSIWNPAGPDAPGGEVIRVEPGFVEQALGLAVDIGTTTVAGYLCDLGTGALLATESMMNPQVTFGEDVMARITYCMTTPNGLSTLNSAILEGLGKIAHKATKQIGRTEDDILEAVLVGNTAMHHILLGIDPEPIGRAPFAPSLHHSVDLKARDLGLKIWPSANVHVLPIEAGFVGADNVGVLIAEEPYKQDSQLLIIDIGTNGELVMGSRRKLISSSCATGPAFEGAHIRFGMRAAPGAIEKLRIDPETLEVRYKTIGQDLWSDELPKDQIQAKGLCGSGIMDVAAELWLAGVVEPNGRFATDLDHPRSREGEKGYEFVIAWADETSIGQDITVNVDDIRAIQLAKAAMYMGAKVMMRTLGIEKVDKVILAGAFGSYIDKVESMAMGLFPDCELDSVYAVGNAAGDGARIALLNVDKRQEANTIARQVEYTELSVHPDFQEEFVAAMPFPHGRDSFPHLAEVLGRARAGRVVRILRRVPGLAGLPRESLHRIAQASEERNVKRRETVYAESSAATHAYLVRKGKVGLFQQTEQGEVEVGSAAPGELFGVEALDGGAPHSATARAMASCELLALPREVLQAVLESSSSVSALHPS